MDVRGLLEGVRDVRSVLGGSSLCLGMLKGCSGVRGCLGVVGGCLGVVVGFRSQ